MDHVQWIQRANRAQRVTAFALLVGLAVALAAAPADAQRRGGGMRGGGGGMRGGGMSRGMARPSVTSRPSMGARPSYSSPPNIGSRPNVGSRPDIGRPGGNNIGNTVGNRTNINVDRPINVNDVNGIIRGDGRWDPGYGCCNHPIAAGAAVVAGAALTAAAIGSVVYSLPVSCSLIVVNTVTYNQCDDVWYQPQFVGTDTQYVVVAPPQ